jgi:hypothetical protein
MRLKSFWILAIVAFLIFPATSMALPVSAISIRYFNASGQVIGQQIRYCNNTTAHAGNISSNPYYVDESYGCGQSTVTCTQLAPGWNVNCRPSGFYNTYEIVSFNAPLGLTQDEWCSGNTSYPWGYSPVCGEPAPFEDAWALGGNTVWYSGWN